jgi:hypothetical protein
VIGGDEFEYGDGERRGRADAGSDVEQPRESRGEAD